MRQVILTGRGPGSGEGTQVRGRSQEGRDLLSPWLSSALFPGLALSPRLHQHPGPGLPSLPSLSFHLKSMQVLLHDPIGLYPLTPSTRSLMSP